MRLSIDIRDLLGHRTRLEQHPVILRQRLWKSLRVSSLEAERGIKSEMPVDTGRARASWGHWTSQDIVKADSMARSSDAHYEEDSGALTIEQGSNVDYIGRLNDGSSTQAPRGFIDRNADKAARNMSKRAQRIGFEVPL